LAHISRVGHAFSAAESDETCKSDGGPPFGLCLQQQTEGSIEGEEEKLLESWCRNSRDAAWHLKGHEQVAFLFSNETLFKEENGHQEIIKLKGAKRPLRTNGMRSPQHLHLVPLLPAPPPPEEKKNLSILLPLFFFVAPPLRLAASRSLLFVHRQHLPAQIKTFAAVGFEKKKKKRRGSSSTAPNIRPIRSQHATGTFQF
jgi:hypothetical protein